MTVGRERIPGVACWEAGSCSQTEVPLVDARQDQECGAPHLEEAMVVDHAILCVQQGQQRVLGMQQHLALPLLLALNSLLAPLLKGEDLQESMWRKRTNVFLFPGEQLDRGSMFTSATPGLASHKHTRQLLVLTACNARRALT